LLFIGWLFVGRSFFWVLVVVCISVDSLVGVGIGLPMSCCSLADRNCLSNGEQEKGYQLSLISLSVETVLKREINKRKQYLYLPLLMLLDVHSAFYLSNITSGRPRITHTHTQPPLSLPHNPHHLT